ncbi:MAG TPA: bifunctional tRNA (5-methylaminomethyl-2-thiouridine)(34)-methyltransferase MnmD/FAD-dependent 5-carboxymethylaminomethyl-2-thiouridine(34) oxidoreductase MnmC [Rhodocyclaceae bacterium]|nr:bifunctional tRNA (5-methylaminomethyl-2-thiouridine)(34)-methyltransferase MnmD/FAD-dependent 5-carboxymethylaminomethyl-2-thiouridine(34) oxidoreductase MnmC [Rhodocyclaceae bacterium]
MVRIEPARLAFGPDGTPFSEAYGDVYHSASGGPDQARHVFLAGNGLPERWQGQERFVILETGFGLGLNFLTTWAAWKNDPQRCGRLHFVSVEKHPFTAADLEIAHRAWPEFASLAAELRRHWPFLLPGVHRLNLEGSHVMLTIVFGDAVDVLRRLDAGVDAFYLDGFSPAKNPDLWSPQLFRALARLASPGATLATWSVAGAVREALAAAEFDLEKRPGFAGKRQMLVGRYRSRKPATHLLPKERRAIVIGAGVAGSATAHRLAARGWQVDVLERSAAPGTGASGNIAGVLRPLPSIDDNRLARLTRAGFLATRSLLQELGPAVRWQECGVMHLARDNGHEDVQRRTVAALEPPTDFLQFLESDAASARLKWPVANGGWWFPTGGWVQPPSLCRAALEAFPGLIRARFDCPVAAIEPTEAGWRAVGPDGAALAEAPVLVMASGAEATRFRQFAWLPQRAARGQVTHIPEDATPPLDMVVCRLGYATPPVDGLRIAGASFLVGDDEPAERPEEHADNLVRLNMILPDFAPGLDPATLTGKVGFRPASPDRLPMVGPVPQPARPEGPGRHQLAWQEGLYCVQGFGARGIVWSGIMAELLASRIDGDPLPLETDLVEAVAPARFLLKAARRSPAPFSDHS